MEKDKNITYISEHQRFKPETESPVKVDTGVKSFASNPITKNFIKYFHSEKGKFTIKDIFR